MGPVRTMGALVGMLVSCGSDRGGQTGDDGSGVNLTLGTGASEESAGFDTSGASTRGDATDAADESEGPTKFDVPSIPDAASGCGGGGKGDGGGPDFSYIWVANSTQGTVSKINTQSLVEEGRYRVRSDSAGSPSRTSVSLNGDVAVANRLSGVTKIYARHADCPDANNTSSGAGDIKEWQDGCIAWFTPFTYASQRPVAWTQGEFDESTCRYENTKLWTSGANATIDVILMDGETGVVEQTIPIPGVAANFYGIYGGAVDAEGNFWGSQLSIGSLIRVKLSDFSVTVWPMDEVAYGMTVDHQGRPWTCSSAVARFDPTTAQWTSVSGANGAGCMVDAHGVLWTAGSIPKAGSNALFGYDTESLDLVHTIAIPNFAKGISIDFEGNVWAVSTGTDAFRVNPTTGEIATFSGLVGPYTYSDMTGFALSHAGSPEG